MNKPDEKQKQGTPEKKERGGRLTEFSIGNERDVIKNRESRKIDTSERARLVPILPPPKKEKGE
jgi:hypothetical protein